MKTKILEIILNALSVVINTLKLEKSVNEKTVYLQCGKSSRSLS